MPPMASVGQAHLGGDLAQVIEAGEGIERLRFPTGRWGLRRCSWHRRARRRGAWWMLCVETPISARGPRMSRAAFGGRSSWPRWDAVGPRRRRATSGRSLMMVSVWVLAWPSAWASAAAISASSRARFQECPVVELLVAELDHWHPGGDELGAEFGEAVERGRVHPRGRRGCRSGGGRSPWW